MPSQRLFRRFMLLVAPPAVIGTLGWLAQTTLPPFHGFALLPAIVLALLAVVDRVDARLAARPSSAAPLDLGCGDTRCVVTGAHRDAA